MKLTIYVPGALGDRMKKVKTKVNWSEIAQRAFEQKLGEIAASKPKPKMQDVIDRLRASKSKVQSGERARGKEAGVEWAKKRAEFDQLKRVAQLAGSRAPDTWAAGLRWDHLGALGAIATSALGEDEVARWGDVEDFFGNVDVPKDPEALFEFADGFLDGVEEIWEAIEDEV
jgi:hypothetical protein